MAIPSAIIGLLAAICIALPAYFFLWKTYAWHLKQPETVQGGIELLVIYLILALVAMVKRVPWFATAVVLILSMLYLQIHSVLLAAAVAWVLLECLIQVGSAVQRLARAEDGRSQDIRHYLLRMITGIAAWTFGALLLSAFGLGTAASLRVYSIILAGCSIAYAPMIPLSVMLSRGFERLGSRDRFAALIVGVLILTQFGKANYGNDYDSMWYGLRPERVLVGPHSLFDNLRLMHHVYYYPKQFEILTLPLAQLNHGSFIIPFNVVLFAICLLAIYGIVRSLDIERTLAFLVTALVGSIPAFSNMASTAKTDTIQSLYAFIAVLFLWNWSKHRSAPDFCYGLAAVLGMAGTKISAYAYAPMLMLGFLATGVWVHCCTARNGIWSTSDTIGKTGGGWKYSPLVALGIAFCSGIGLMSRSWLLTGTPTMPAFVDKWELLGLTPKYPWSESGFIFSGAPIDSYKEFFLYWGRLLFNPKAYSHYVMAWPGNAGFFFVCVLLILLAFRAVRFNRQIRFLLASLPVMVGGIITACLVRTPDQGFTDGNYYAIPVVLAILSIAGVLASSSSKTRTILMAGSICFLLLQLPIMFVSHWSWHPGTQPFRFVLNKTLFDRKAEIESGLRRAGAWELEEYLQANPGKGLCVGFAGGEETALHALSCIHEDFEQTAPPFWRLFASQEAFRGYLQWAHPDLLIMPKALSYAPCGPGTPIRSVFEELSKNKEVVRVESKNFVALDLTRLSRN